MNVTELEAELLGNLRKLVVEIAKSTVADELAKQSSSQTSKLAVKPGEAASLLGVNRKTMWRLCATGRIKKTTYGVIPIAELQRHLREEINSQ